MTRTFLILTIRWVVYSGPVWITVYLVTSSGQQHYHSIHGPGSTKVPCKEVYAPRRHPGSAVAGGSWLWNDCCVSTTQILSFHALVTWYLWLLVSFFSLDSLSIRRLRNWEGDKELRKRGIDPRTWKRERKEARLLFQAEIPASDGQPEMKLTCKSRIFQCSSCKYLPTCFLFSEKLYHFNYVMFLFLLFQLAPLETLKSGGLVELRVLLKEMRKWVLLERSFHQVYCFQIYSVVRELQLIINSLWLSTLTILGVNMSSFYYYRLQSEIFSGSSLW